MNKDVSVILLAGGKGTRMGSLTPKQFLTLRGKPLSHYSLEVFLDIESVSEVIVVCDLSYRSLFSSYPVKFSSPGERRQDSVYNGLQAISENSSWVCIHDAARPFITKNMVQSIIFEGKKIGAASVGMPLKWTIKQIKEENLVDCTILRDKIWEIQTPQFLSKTLLQQGFQIAIDKQLTVTDDVSLAELVPHPVKLVPGSYANLKITTPEDLAIAESIFQTFLSHENKV